MTLSSKGTTQESGFTLIEMMISILIIASIVVGVVPLFETLQSQSRSKEEQASVDRYIGGLEGYYKQQMQRRIDGAILNVANGGIGLGATSLLLPDVSAAATPEIAAQTAAQTMINTGAVNGRMLAPSLYNATSNASRKIALYINNPDLTATNAGYVQYLTNQAPVVTGSSWGTDYCPNKVMARMASLVTPTFSDRSLLTMAMVISAGPNGVFDTFGGSTVAAAAPAWLTPGFTISGDDKGSIINFSAIHAGDGSNLRNKLHMERLATALGTYFRQNYSKDALLGSQSVATLMATNYYTPVSTVAGIQTNMGIPAGDLVDEYGNEIHVASMMSTQPYTVLLYNNCSNYVAIPATAP